MNRPPPETDTAASPARLHLNPDSLPRPLGPSLRRHREMLAIAAVVVVLAFALEVRPDERVAIRFLPGAALPPSCVTRTWFGLRCPGCGLTRGLVHLAHGSWSEAWRAHRLSGLMALAVLLQFPYRLACLARAGRSPLGPRGSALCAYALIAALIGNWLLELLG